MYLLDLEQGLNSKEATSKEPAMAVVEAQCTTQNKNSKEAHLYPTTLIQPAS
jgi:hypothetical protein